MLPRDVAAHGNFGDRPAVSAGAKTSVSQLRGAPGNRPQRISLNRKGLLPSRNAARGYPSRRHFSFLLPPNS